MLSRRSFLMQAVLVVGAVLTGGFSALAADAKVPESDATAQALGFRHDATKVDAKRFPQRTKDQICQGCMFYTKTDASSGTCQLFVGKGTVSAKGWCMSWAKKPA